MNTTPAVKLNLRDRVKALLSAAIEEGYKFLDASKFPEITRKLIKQGAKNLATRLEKQIESMSDEDLLTQIYFVRDQIIPFLIGDENTNK